MAEKTVESLVGSLVALSVAWKVGAMAVRRAATMAAMKAGPMVAMKAAMTAAVMA